LTYADSVDLDALTDDVLRWIFYFYFI
jgi:hypothetical protein